MAANPIDGAVSNLIVFFFFNLFGAVKIGVKATDRTLIIKARATGLPVKIHRIFKIGLIKNFDCGQTGGFDASGFR